MDVSDAIETRLEIREYRDEPVESATIRYILNAGRLAPSGENRQHWTFVLVEDDDDLTAFAEATSTGKWIHNADFAIVLLTDPQYDYHNIDAGRAVTHMQLAAWSRGVGSCLYTNYDTRRMRDLLEYPETLDLSLVAGFGKPVRPVESFQGRKRRKPLSEVVHRGTYGDALDG